MQDQPLTQAQTRCGRSERMLCTPSSFTKAELMTESDPVCFCTFYSTCSPLKWEKAIPLFPEHTFPSAVIVDGREFFFPMIVSLQIFSDSILHKCQKVVSNIISKNKEKGLYPCYYVCHKQMRKKIKLTKFKVLAQFLFQF